MKKYKILFFGHHPADDPAVIDEANTLEDAKALRRASGDLVCHNREGYPVVQSISWLWDWEIQQKSYAYRKATGK